MQFTAPSRSCAKLTMVLATLDKDSWSPVGKSLAGRQGSYGEMIGSVSANQEFRKRL